MEFPRAATRYEALSTSGLGVQQPPLRDREDKRAAVLLLARARLHVAAVALRTAVLVVVTAHRLRGRRRPGLRQS